MIRFIFFIFIQIPLFAIGQSFPAWNEAPSLKPLVYYYHFVHGVQMIEYDYLTAYWRSVNYLETSRPRAMSWAQVMGPPHENVYIFRNERGVIIKQFGSNSDNSSDSAIDTLLCVEESKKIAVTHNSVLHENGYENFSINGTSYYPYYLIGFSSRLLEDTIGLGLIDSMGNVVLSGKYRGIFKFHNLFITDAENHELRDFNLKVLFSSKDYILSFSRVNIGFVDIYKENKCGLMDSNGKIILPTKYVYEVDKFNEYGLAKVQENNKLGFINRSGEIVIKCKFDQAGEFKEGLLNVKLENKWFYVDTTGRMVFTCKYANCMSYNEGFARVCNRDEKGQYHCGFIDKKGNEVVPLRYQNISDFHNGVAIVQLDGKVYKINTQGKIIN